MNGGVRLRRFREKREEREIENGEKGRWWSNDRIRRVGNPHNGPTLGIISTLSTCHTLADET